MARMRTIKPGFFTNEDIVELDFGDRLLFIGLWTLADREGRLEDRPKKIKMTLFPADDIDINRAIDNLSAKGFVRRYEVNGTRCIQIEKFSKHQRPHHQESESILPPPEESEPLSGEGAKSSGEGECQSAFNGVNGDNRIHGSSGDEPPAKKEYPDWFEEIWRIKPKRDGSDPKRQAFQSCNARLKDGRTVDDLKAGLIRYRRYLEHKGMDGTDKQMQMVRFFGKGEEYRESWSTPSNGPLPPNARMA